MGSIQGSINSMLGSASRAVMAVKGYNALKAKQQRAAGQEAAKTASGLIPSAPTAISPQERAAQRAKQSATNAVQAKSKQRRNFMSYLADTPSSLGRVGDLDPTLQKKIAQGYSSSMRKRIMDAADKEAKNGKHK